MNSAYKSRTGEELLGEQLKIHRTVPVNRQQLLVVGTPPTPPMPPPPPPEPLRVFSDRTAGGIYVIGGDANMSADSGIAGTRNSESHSNAATMDRKQLERMSWLNMRRLKDDDAAASTSATSVTVTPSPQTTRSYISSVSTGNVNGGGRVGRATTTCTPIGVGGSSGRDTATSSRISTSRATTISGSNNTLNDIHSDYHSHEAVSSDYPYTGAGVSPMKNPSSNGSFNMTNGSTVKLLPPIDDELNQQTKCSVVRGLVLCICLNLTYANVVRFPRELDKYGSAYLIPYVSLLFLVGLPIILLEISMGQFLGQGAAHTWRASPIFKGACIISRFASWLSTIWVSLHAVVALAYIGMFLFNTLPFRECVDDIRILENRYIVTGNSGQECLQKTFLTALWKNPFYFGLLSIGLICIWIVVMLCTHNGKIVRRSFFVFGLLGFLLLCCLTGWEVYDSVHCSHFPELWPFESELLLESNIWFNALMQVLFATNCGFGALPMVTGKFLYKGDAVRTSVVYLCFNLLISVIAVTLFMVQYDLPPSVDQLLEELKPMTAIYDHILYDRPNNELLVKFIPVLIYVLILIAAIVSMSVAVYTATRLVPRHPNYVISLIGLVVAIISLSAPKFVIARILDTRVVGTVVITALIFDLIAVTWIYGAKNIYTDLEFSIGRPIFKGWIGLWCICPAILTALLVWWCSDDDQYDLMAEYLPRWAPILFALAVIFIIACVQIFRQVEYNFFGMICEASKSAKEWGPADPLARHAWKQWRSVCQDTGRRDFTLRRRGTRDYTHSIKKGQYSTSTKYANGQANQQNWKSSTPGNSSPNYSGSMFGDSAIEEDISVDKFHGISQQFVPFEANDGKPLRYSHRSRAQQRAHAAQQQLAQQHHSHNHVERPPAAEKHREVVYIRRLSGDGQHATRIEITPSNESITYGGAHNPLGKSFGGVYGNTVNVENNRNSVMNVGIGAAAVPGAKLPPLTVNGSTEHVCWRRLPMSSKEYATEL